MENENSNFKDTKLEKIKYALFAAIGLMLVVFGSLYDFESYQPKVMSKQLDQDLPQYGWNVTDDLDVGEVPGGPTAQRFELRQEEGWQVLAYCLNPDVTPPPIGTSCQLIDENTFWCGNDLQQLREYQILQQPPPEQEDTPTPTVTLTSTATSTSTATATSTQTPTATNAPTGTTAPTQSFTPTPRPKMGGGGNFSIGVAISLTLGFLMIGIGLSLTAVDWKRYIPPFKKK